MSDTRSTAEARPDEQHLDGRIERGRDVARALLSDTVGFLALLGPLAGLMLTGLVAALVFDVDAELRSLLVLACGVPFAGLTWLIVWVIKSPLDARATPRNDPEIDR